LRLSVQHLLAVAAIVFAWRIAEAVAAPTWSLRLNSEPGAFIGEGQTYLYLDRTEPINVLAFSHSQSVGPDGIEFFHSIDSVAPTFFIRLGTKKLLQPLAVGQYSNAQRAFFENADVPGFDFTFAGHAANMLTATFTITDIAYRFLNKEVGYTLFQLDKISFTFTEFADGSPHPISGAFAFNTSLPQQIPEPPTLIALLMALFGYGVMRIMIKASSRG
jgi:hypothetical protein